MVSPDSGGHGEGETPLPIPNREVKPLSADGTWPARARESRTPPVIPRTGRLRAARSRLRAPPRGCAQARRLAAVLTERLELCPLGEEDLDALVELDGFAAVRATVDPFAEHIPLDATERRDYERRLVDNASFVGAVERASGKLLGWFQVEPARDGSGEVELGYRLRPDAWGRGFATEGAAALLDDALARAEVTRVYAHALHSNAASRRVMGRFGRRCAGGGGYKGLPGAEWGAVPRRGAAAGGRAPRPCAPAATRCAPQRPRAAPP